MTTSAPAESTRQHASCACQGSNRALPPGSTVLLALREAVRPSASMGVGSSLLSTSASRRVPTSCAGSSSSLAVCT